MRIITGLATASFLSLVLPLLSQAAPPQHLKSTLTRVLLIVAVDEHQQPISLGSAFLVGPNGEIATNYHVIQGATSATARFVGSDERYAISEIIAVSTDDDLAILRIPTTASPLKLGDDQLLAIGERVLAVGNPEGLEGTVSEGIVSGFRKVREGLRLIQITAPISPGSSGGPVLAPDGTVVGVASASLMSGQNLNFAIPASNLAQLLASNQASRPFEKSALARPTNSIVGAGSGDPTSVKVVRVEIITRWTTGKATLSISIRNDSNRDVKNLKLIVRWKSKNGEVLHYSALAIPETISAKNTRTIRKEKVESVGDLPTGVDSEARVLDFEILKTSGSLDFK